MLSILFSGSELRDVMRPGTKVMLNASLIDEKRQIQYLASLVWRRVDFPSSNTCMKNMEIDQQLLQIYFDVNEIFAMDDGGGSAAAQAKFLTTNQMAPAANAPQQPAEEEFPTFYKAQTGLVYRLLDENFGLLRVSNSLALFDVCDLWIRPNTTASKAGKRLSDVVQVDTKVKFHATLLERREKVQYLASSVWLASDSTFQNAGTSPIERDKIHEDKVNIYRTVLKSVSGTLPVLKSSATLAKNPGVAVGMTMSSVGAPGPAAAVAARPVVMDTDVECGLTGTVLFNFVDAQNKILGGVILVEQQRGLCFFPLSSAKLPKELIKVTCFLQLVTYMS